MASANSAADHESSIKACYDNTVTGYTQPYIIQDLCRAVSVLELMVVSSTFGACLFDIAL